MEIDSGKSVTDREDEGTVVEVKDALGNQMYDPPLKEGQVKPTAENKPVTIKIAGTYSDRFKKARLKVRDRNLIRARQRLEAETLEQQERQVCAESIIEWDGFTSGGKPFEFTPKNAALLFTLHPWIYDQCVIAQNDHAGFSKAPSES